MSAPTRDQTFIFGPFTLRPTARRLERKGAKVALGDRAFDILVVLVRQAGTVITKKEIMSLVWRDVTVDEGNLRVRLVELRRALDEPEKNPTYIANVKGQGYCFVGSLAQYDAQDSLPIKKDLSFVSQQEKQSRTVLIPPSVSVLLADPIAAAQSSDLTPFPHTVFEIELPTGLKIRAIGEFDEVKLRSMISEWL